MSHGHVYILDVETVQQLPPDTFRATCSSGLMFTKKYAAPEIVQSHEVSLTSDLYSVGVMLDKVVKVSQV